MKGKLFSEAPNGKKYPLPDNARDEKEREIIAKFVDDQKKLGRQIVVVQGLGFVGAVMAAVVADAKNSPFFVIGCQRPSTRSFWKIPVINSGLAPVKSNNLEIEQIFARCVRHKQTFHATWLNDAFKYADVVIVDIQLDAIKPELGKADRAYCDLKAFQDGIREIGRHIPFQALVLIETTVPVGACQKIAKPIIEEEFQKRGADLNITPPRIVHSYERVMPGPKFVWSIRNYPRVFAGIDNASARMADKFLSRVIQAPLTELNDTNASEAAKLMENLKRAADIALANQLAIVCEKCGINYFTICEAIKQRRGTHDNMCKPSLGVGGYCLTKDPVLLKFGAQKLLGLTDLDFTFATGVVNINDLMPCHTFELIQKGLNNNMEGKK